MTDPTPGTQPGHANDGRILPQRVRLYLYFAAGIIFTLWLSLEILGAAGFTAFVVGMIAAQAAFCVRPSLNAAFVVGMIAYALTLGVWSVAIGPPRSSHGSPTATSVPSP
jgi:hypothetical protein